LREAHKDQTSLRIFDAAIEEIWEGKLGAGAEAGRAAAEAIAILLGRRSAEDQSGLSQGEET